jgi:hypothetical protein
MSSRAQARHVEQTLDIGLDHLVPVLGTLFLDLFAPSGHTGVVHEHVHRGEQLMMGAPKSLNRAAVANIELKDLNAHAVRSRQLLANLRQSFPPPRREDQISTRRCKRPGASLADPAGCSCNENRHLPCPLMRTRAKTSHYESR